MARIMQRALYCDSDPAVLLIPILDLARVKAGPDEYEVLIVCLDPQVYQEMVLIEKTSTCSPDEIKLAFDTFKEFMLAAAYHLSTKSDADFDKLGRDEKKELKKTVKALKGTKQLPYFVPGDSLADKKVAKVSFSSGENKSHAGVDAWLLLLKNVSMCSSTINFKLLPEREFSANDKEKEPEDVTHIPKSIRF